MKIGGCKNSSLILCHHYCFILSDEEIVVGVWRRMAWPFFEIRCYVWYVWSSEVARQYQESTGVNRRTSSRVEPSFNIWGFLVMNCSRLPQCCRRQHIKTTELAGLLYGMYRFIFCVLLRKKDHCMFSGLFVSIFYSDHRGMIAICDLGVFKEWVVTSYCMVLRTWE
jgi:hypothetical protein